jgi:putative hydrolase of the HAD superfamily
MRYAAVVFDHFGTLTPETPRAVWRAHATRSAVPLGIPVDRWAAALDDSFGERATGALGTVEEQFRALARRCGVEPSEAQLAAACAERRAAQRTLFELRPEAGPVLRLLRSSGIRLGVLTDCTVELAEAWPELETSWLVDAVVMSCVTGVRKPDPAMYLAIASELGVPAEECLYVGDGGSRELDGAAKAGMTPVLLRTADWQLNHAYDRPTDWTGGVVTSLRDVPALVL